MPREDDVVCGLLAVIMLVLLGALAWYVWSAFQY
jgi:hypothetical protein